jgi:hypothetical protein
MVEHAARALGDGAASGASTSVSQKAFWIAATIGLWLGATYLGWVGYGGSDDLVYADYAYHLGELPRYTWQFRLPGILALHLSYALFGPSEFAATVPTLVGSLVFLASVAWFVDWPRTIDWKSQGSMFLAATLPLDAELRTCPGMTQIATPLLAMGTASILKGKGAARYAGALLMALGFMAHEMSVFYVAIFCLAALAFDWRRLWRPVAATVLVSGFLVLTQCVACWALLGDPLARYARVAGGSGAGLRYILDQYYGGSKLLFYATPIRMLIFDKGWGIGPILLLVSAIAAWRRLDGSQRVLLATVFFVWLWLGYGTYVPWRYSPVLHVGARYYMPIVLGLTALLPVTLAASLRRHQGVMRGTLVMLIVLNVALLLAGRQHFGQDVAVSRDLLRFAREHESQVFVTDVGTLNHMYFLNGFRWPSNVATVEQLGYDLPRDARRSGNLSSRQILMQDLRAWHGVGVPHVEPSRVEGILLNHQRRRDRPQEPTFAQYVQSNKGNRVRISPVKNRLLLAPLQLVLGQRDWMVRNRGGELILIKHLEQPACKTSD